VRLTSSSLKNCTYSSAPRRPKRRGVAGRTTEDSERVAVDPRPSQGHCNYFSCATIRQGSPWLGKEKGEIDQAWRAAVKLEGEIWGGGKQWASGTSYTPLLYRISCSAKVIEKGRNTGDAQLNTMRKNKERENNRLRQNRGVTERRVLIDLWPNNSEEQCIPQKIAQHAVEVSSSGVFLERDVIVNGTYSRRRGRFTRTTPRGD
jgi:hypothetical protein